MPEHVRVFVSHKSDDFPLADGLRSLIVKSSSGVRVFLSEKGICAGEEWDRKIRRELAQSDLLILLYTDPSKQWDWPLFEAGLYTPLAVGEEAKRKPIVCMHLGKQAPPPLRDVESIRIVPQTLPRDANDSAVSNVLRQNRPLLNRFLRPAFLTGKLTGEPWNEDLGPADLSRMVLFLAGLFGRSAAVRRTPFAPRFVFEYPPDVAVRADRIPAEVTVRAQDGDLSLFGLAGTAISWEELATALEAEEVGTEWAQMLARFMSGAARDRLPRGPIQACLRNPEGKIFRPALDSMERSSDGRNAFFVLFGEQPAPEFWGGPGDAGMVFNVLRLTNRFRDEVLDPCLSRIRRDPNAEVCRRACGQLRERIRLIEEEGERAGLTNAEAFLAAFGDRQLIAEIGRITREWEAFRERIFGEQTIPPAELRHGLEKMLDLNGRFRLLAARRYAELVERGREQEAPRAGEPFAELLPGR